MTGAASATVPQAIEWNHATIFPITSASSRSSTIAGLLLVIFLVLYALLLHGFYEPANPGVDQNGYMVTARQLTQHDRLYFTLRNPLEFAAGNMVQMTRAFSLNFRLAIH